MITIPGETVAAANVMLGIDSSGLTSGLAAAKAQVANADFGTGLRTAFQKGDMAGVGKQLGNDLVQGVSSQFGMLGGVAGNLATAIGPAGVALLAGGAAAAVLGAGIASCVSTAADFQQSMANVASVTGGGEEALNALSAAAREAGAGTVFSAKEAAEAEYFLASAGMSTEEIVASLGDTLLLAGAGGLEMGRSAEIVTGTLAQFKMEAEDSTRVANVLAAAAAGSNTTINQLGEGMKNAGAFANAAGVSFEMTSAALMVLADSNIKGAEGGTALKSMIASLLAPSKEAIDTLAEMGLTAEDVSLEYHTLDEVLQTLSDHEMTAAQSSKIFGKEMAGAGTVLVSGAEDLDAYTESITGTSKAQEMYNTQTDTFQGSMKMLSSAVEEAKISIGTGLLPVLSSIVQVMAMGVTDVTNFGKAINAWLSGTSIDEETGEVIEKGNVLEQASGRVREWGDKQGWLSGYLSNYDKAKEADAIAKAAEEALEAASPEIKEAAEGVGEDAGSGVVEGFDRQMKSAIASGDFSKISGEAAMQAAAGWYNSFYSTQYTKMTGTGSFSAGSDTLSIGKEDKGSWNFKLMLNGIVIDSAQTTSDLFRQFQEKFPALALLTDPREWAAAVEEAKGNEALAIEMRAQIVIDDIAAEEAARLYEEAQSKFEDAYNNALGRGFAVGGLGGRMAEMLEDVAEDGWKAFEDGLIEASEASDISEQLADLKLADPEAFEKAGGDAALSWWNRLVGLLEQRSYNIANNIDCTGIDEVIQDHINAGEPYVAKVTAEIIDKISPEAGALREMLWWHEYGGSKTQRGLGEFADDFYELGKYAEEVGGDFEDAYDIILNPWEYSAGELQIAKDYLNTMIAGLDIDPKAVDAIAKYANDNFNQGMDKAERDLNAEWARKSEWMPMSRFGYWQENTAGLFYESYAGPQEGYAGRGKGAKPGYESANFFEPYEAELVLNPVLAPDGKEALEGEIESDLGVTVDEVSADIDINTKPTEEALAMSGKVALDAMRTGAAEVKTSAGFLHSQLTDAGRAFSAQVSAGGKSAYASLAAGANQVRSAAVALAASVEMMRAGSYGVGRSSPWSGKSTSPGLNMPGYGYAFAEGGIVTHPVSAIIGDAPTPEVVAPLGNLLPMIQQAVAGAGGIVINQTINAADGASAYQIAREVADELETRLSQAYAGRGIGGYIATRRVG